MAQQRIPLHQVVHERPDGLDDSALFGKDQEAEQTDDSLSYARRSFSSDGVVKNEHIRSQFLGQVDGLRFPTAKLGAHLADCSLVCDVVTHNPLGLADCVAPGLAMSMGGRPKGEVQTPLGAGTPIREEAA